MSLVFYIIPLLIIAIILGSLVKNTLLQFLTLCLLNLFIIGELISIYFSGGLIDYQFYVNLNLADMLAGLAIFKWQALLATLCFIGLLVLCAKLSQWLAQNITKTYLFALLGLSLFSICLNNGPVARFNEIIQVTQAEAINFSEALNNVQIDSQHYPLKSMLNAQKGKNIIVISLESLEQGFLSPTFAHLTPNLNRLSQELTYYPHMPMMPGSSWTLASMYTYMTGVPLFLGGYSTSLFDDKQHSRLVSLGDVINKAGYQSRYLIGNPDFAGMAQAISLFGIEVVSEKTYPGRYPTAPFGLYDYDLFELAKHEIEQLTASDQPFALFISTVSTHAPNGFYDKRMEAHVTPGQSDLEFTVASLDYNLGQFITYLTAQDLLDNTVIFIFPDHQIMGYGTQVIDKLAEQPRGLYLITNADQQNLNKATSETLYQIDLPRLIINGAQITTNAKFLTDYLNQQDKADFITHHKADIAALNSSSLAND